MSPNARRFFGCALPLVLALGGCATCAMVAYASQIFVVVTPARDASMAPVLEPGANVVVDNTAFWSAQPVLSELVWVNSPEGRIFRRVAGRPGETVEVRSGVAVVNGVPLDQPCASNEGAEFGPLTLGPDEFFVLADDRSQPDSREWGPLTRRDLFGSAAVLRVETGNGFAPVLRCGDVE
jgi:signal peptidase I